jgi:hypothetical protein
MDEQVLQLGRAYADRLREILGAKFHGAYLYGAAVFPENFPTGDVDAHVILEGELTDEERSGLEEMHTSLAREHPSLGGEMDVYYLLLSDARKAVPPRSQLWRRAVDESWALECEHIRRGRHFVLHGPDPRTVYPAVSWEQIREALLWEWRYAEDRILEYPAFSVLNLCRIVYSFETRDVVVSKAFASEWAMEELPQWTDLIEIARMVYLGLASDGDLLSMGDRLEELLAWVRAQIAGGSSDAR